MIELDHLFIIARERLYVAESPAEEATSTIASRCADLLRTAGFCEGPANTHPGQGTANRRFFFDGFMLEFLYVNDPPALRSSVTSTLRMSDRFQSPDASLFGVGSRSAGSVDREATYDSVSYKPDYLPGALHIQVARDIGYREPLWFHLPFVHTRAPVVEACGETGASNAHDNGASVLTDLTLESPYLMSETSREIADALGVELRLGLRQCAYLEFDHARQGRRVDELLSYGLHVQY